MDKILKYLFKILIFYPRFAGHIGPSHKPNVAHGPRVRDHWRRVLGIKINNFEFNFFSCLQTFHVTQFRRGAG